MKTGQSKGKVDSLLVLLLFGVFAICILSVLLTGADTYQRLASRDQHSYDRRTAAQYLATRVHQADQAGTISVRSFENCPSLVLTEEIDGSLYETYIYCHDGYIRELFAAAGGGFMPEDGEKILAANDLLIAQDAQTLTLSILTEEGQLQNVQLFLRSGREVAP